MPEWLLLASLVLLGIPVLLAIWLIFRTIDSGRRIEELTRRLASLELEIYRLKRETKPALPVTPATETQPAPTAAQKVEIPQKFHEAIPVKPVEQPPPLPPREVSQPPSLEPSAAFSKLATPGLTAPSPLPTAEVAMPEPASEPPPPIAPTINWEQFMGVKLFAWVGGLALFIGVAFFVKYAFDKNLIPPELRVAIGFIAGLGLLVGGVMMSRKNYAVLSHTLCATGVVILYAVTFACRSVYHFPFFGFIPTFVLMALITTTACFLAVRLEALVVAILGMLGGFLTPALLSTGHDNPLGLFGYIAILDAGLILVALHRRWYFLTALAATGTIFTQIGWAHEFFTAEKYFEGNKIFVALAILFGFNALYLAAVWWAKRREQSNWWLAGALLGLGAITLFFTAWFLSFPTLAQRPWLIFGFVFLIDLIFTALVLIDDEVTVVQPIAGLAVFGLLALWTTRSLSNELLNAALAFYFIFAVVHAAFPFVMQRGRGVTGPLWGSQVFPALALLLVLIPIFKLTEVPFLVWPFVLLVDVLAIALAVMSASILPVIVMLVLTLAATAGLIFKIPATLTGLSTSLFLLGAFAVFFVMAGVWLTRKFKPEAITEGVKPGDDLALPANLAAQLPAISASLPFLLLIMATLRLPLPNPSPVFGVALLLVVLLLGVTKLFSVDQLPAVALAGVIALESAWHFNDFNPAQADVPLTWYLLFFAVFAIFPFLFMHQFKDKIVPWATAALAGPAHFFLIHRLVSASYPNDVMGLLPAAFALPSLVSLVVVLKKFPLESAARMTQLAWFGGIGLFFISLIFPIQFDREWITIGWGLEGLALLWLFHRVPHPGLRLVGVGLLIVAFVRLALNPAVLTYHPRSATPILNWYLYTYGIVTVCLFMGARLLAPPRHQIFNWNAPPFLAGLGTVLAFLLLNIEIADFFSPPGATLTFQFKGNFARDMTYSIAWALFALVLLVVGIVKKIPGARYSALGLLSVTLLKLFFHDLARLGQLYRIGAFIGVAVIAMLASFAYQRFFSATVKEKEMENELPPAQPGA